MSMSMMRVGWQSVLVLLCLNGVASFSALSSASVAVGGSFIWVCSCLVANAEASVPSVSSQGKECGKLQPLEHALALCLSHTHAHTKKRARIRKYTFTSTHAHTRCELKCCSRIAFTKQTHAPRMIVLAHPGMRPGARACNGPGLRIGVSRALRRVPCAVTMGGREETVIDRVDEWLRRQTFSVSHAFAYSACVSVCLLMLLTLLYVFVVQTLYAFECVLF